MKKHQIGPVSQKIKRFLEIEGQRILSKVGDRDFVIALAIEGRTFSSEEFSKQLEEASIKGFSTLTFIIGGSLGLAQDVKKEPIFLLVLVA